MTSEQLQSARAERWRQVSNPVLTADDARAWLDGIGLCLFLSRRSHASGLASAPAPSFVEAVAGAPSEASSREAIENATSLMHRLAGDGSVVPLNLSGVAGAFGNGGAAGISASDQPDFLVTRAALPYVFSLVGGRNWKSGPGGKASPLMTEVWTLLNEKGARTAAEIQTELGREVTEAAVLRALLELWHGLRTIPVYDGQTTRWELTQARFAAEMTASQKVAQTTALSALVSLYLEAVIAASAEEVETFLSPLASRSRVREVVNGLSATRQLGLISVAAQPLFHVAGSLPEFAEEEVAAAKPVRSEIEPRHKRPSREAGFQRGPRVGREDTAARKPFERRSRPDRGAERKGFDHGGGQWKDRARGGAPGENRGPAREGRGFERRDAQRFTGPFFKGGDERPGSRSERPGRERDGGGRVEGERRPFGKKPFEKSARPFGARPFDRERTRPSAGMGGKFPPKKFGAGKGRPWQDRGESRDAGRPAGGGERPFRPRGEEERGGGRPGERGPGRKFDGAKFGSRSGSGPRSSGQGPRREGTGRGFERERPGEKRPFFRDREASGERPRESGAGGAGSQRREGGWKPKGSGGGFSKQGRPAFRSSGRPGFKSGKPGYKPGYGREKKAPGSEAGGEFRTEGRPAFKKSGDGKSAKPFGRPGKPFGKSTRPGGAGKSFGKSAKPFGKSGRPVFGKGKPGFGAKRPGGSKSGGPGGSKSGRPGGARPPFRKRKDEGGENAG